MTAKKKKYLIKLINADIERKYKYVNYIQNWLNETNTKVSLMKEV